MPVLSESEVVIKENMHFFLTHSVHFLVQATPTLTKKCYEISGIVCQRFCRRKASRAHLIQGYLCKYHGHDRTCVLKQASEKPSRKLVKIAKYLLGSEQVRNL